MTAAELLDVPSSKDDYIHCPEVETMPRGRLESLQLERLKSSLRHAEKNVPLVRERFAETGVTSDDVKSLADIAKFPFTEKTDFRDHYPFGLFAIPRREIRRLHASSGTSGKATVVGYSERDLDNWADLMARTMACVGVRPGDVVQNAFGYGLFTGGLGAHYGAERLGCTVVPISGGGTNRQIDLLLDFGTNVLTCTPSYALNIAEQGAKRGIDFSKTELRVGFFGAEPWSETMRQELEQGLGIKACDNYGLSEIMGPGVAGECSVAQNGMHYWEDQFLFEIIDPETMEPKPDGEQGELVITTLTKEALPVVRYRTRDITAILGGGPCACGRTHKRIQRIAGRNDDMLIVRGVNLFPMQIEAALVGHKGITPFYQLIVSRTGVSDDITVEVEAREDTPLLRYADVAKLVHIRLREAIGISCKIEVRGPGEIPRSEGKAVRVKDLRP